MQFGESLVYKEKREEGMNSSIVNFGLLMKYGSDRDIDNNSACVYCNI
jgi:hypothetical protein